MTVLVTDASEHGATGEIAEAIAQTLRGHGLSVLVLAPQDVTAVQEYEAVVLGSAFYALHWLTPAKDLVARCASELATRPVWLFSSGPVGDPSRKLVQKMGEDPVDLADICTATRAREHHMFPGKLEKQNLSRPQRAALALFRGFQGEFRNWAEIERWSKGIAESLVPSSRS